jgi:hypothetical protein
MIDLLLLKRKARDKEPCVLLFACTIEKDRVTAQVFQYQSQLRKGAKLRLHDANGQELGFVTIENPVRFKPQSGQTFTVQNNKVKMDKPKKVKPLPEGTLTCFEFYLQGVFRRVS